MTWQPQAMQASNCIVQHKVFVKWLQSSDCVKLTHLRVIRNGRILTDARHNPLIR
jgi:hypothetical protein